MVVTTEPVFPKTTTFRAHAAASRREPAVVGVATAVAPGDEAALAGTSVAGGVGQTSRTVSSAPDPKFRASRGSRGKGQSERLI
jgi:hypothetical protein